MKYIKQEIFRIQNAQVTRSTDDRYHKRDDYKFCCVEFILDGEGLVRIGDKEFQVKKNDVYILPPRHAHEYYSTGEKFWRKIYFKVAGTLLPRLLDIYELGSKFHFPDCRPELVDRFRKIIELYTSGVPDYNIRAALVVHDIVIFLNEEFKRKKSGVSSSLAVIMDYMDSQIFTETNLKDICRKMGISKESLTRIFKQEVGVSPWEYFLSKRFESAKSLLLNTDLNISEISCRLKFNDPYYFSKFFKKRQGFSPVKFRNHFDRKDL